MSTETFTGPLFLVGMPRSGTKLLRTLLNEHPYIYIAQVETHFILYWHANWSSYGDLKNPLNFRKFYSNSIKLPYFTYTQEQQTIISYDDWYRSCKGFDLPDIFEALIKHDSHVPSDAFSIWGDKSPSYLLQMPLLKAKLLRLPRGTLMHSLGPLFFDWIGL